MTKTELEGYRKELLALANRLKSDMSSLKEDALRSTGGDAAGNLSKLPLHLADLGSDSYDQELAVSLLENDTLIATEIRAALERMEQGAFGRCEECGREVSKERLQAVPFTRYCIDCAQRLEREGVTGRNTTLP
jgi:DnaK suppressor protein